MNELNDAGNAHSQQKYDHDFILQLLVSAANSDGLSGTITVMIGGALVSGTLCPTRTYHRYLADTIGTAFSSGEVRKQYVEAIMSLCPSDEQLQDEHTDAPRFIHLCEVSIYSPGRPQFAVTTSYWRGRISEITGFFEGAPPTGNVS